MDKNDKEIIKNWFKDKDNVTGSILGGGNIIVKILKLFGLLFVFVLILSLLEKLF